MDDINSTVNKISNSIMLDFNQFNLDANTVNDRCLEFLWGFSQLFCKELMADKLLTDMSRIIDIHEPTERQSLLAAAFEAQQKGSWKEFSPSI
ncbi:hypothetical protein H0H87_011549, partial [Tephrocybe sp. NHM501043]